jgi:hypothetical protein
LLPLFTLAWPESTQLSACAATTVPVVVTAEADSTVLPKGTDTAAAATAMRGHRGVRFLCMSELPVDRSGADT